MLSGGWEKSSRRLSGRDAGRFLAELSCHNTDPHGDLKSNTPRAAMSLAVLPLIMTGVDQRLGEALSEAPPLFPLAGTVACEFTLPFELAPLFALDLGVSRLSWDDDVGFVAGMGVWDIPAWPESACGPD